MRHFYIIISALLLGFSSLALGEEPPTPEAAQATPEPPEKTQDMLLYALSLNGMPYKYGGRSQDSGFDCSGFVRYVFNETLGMNLPATAASISKFGTHIPRQELKPGDLVFFNTLRRAFSHVGIYLGDNRFIHASSSSTGLVMVSDMTDKYWAKRYNGARRVGTSEQLASAPANALD